MKRKKKTIHTTPKSERDTMRPEYDFSKGVRGKHSARYREGTNVVVINSQVRNLRSVAPGSDSIHNESKKNTKEPDFK